MIALLKKDFVFNYKWLLVLVFICVVMPVVFAFDNDTRLTPILFIFSPILANGWFLPKSCYLDDNAPTRMFLNTLPLPKSSVIGSKYLLGLICAVLSLFIISLLLIILKVEFAMQSVIISFVWLIVYYAVFLLSFYIFNYGVAEKANQALQMITIFTMFFLDRTGVVLDSMTIAPVALIIMPIASLLIYTLSFLLSVRAQRDKNLSKAR